MSRFPCAIAICLALTACGGGDEAPTGQVVATVNGEEITTAQLNLELGGQGGGTPAEQQARRQAALQAIVDRTILAQAAREADLDGSPSFTMLNKRAEQMVLIDLLARGAGVGGAATKIGDQEVAAFIQSNPERFGERRLYVVDQVNVQANDPALLKVLEPINSLAEAREVLSRRGVPFGETIGVVDTLGVDPAAARQLSALTPGTVFITPDPNVVHVNQLRESQSKPITGETAIRAARAMMEGDRAQGLSGNRIEALLKAGRPKVKINEDFKAQPATPPATPAAAK